MRFLRSAAALLALGAAAALPARPPLRGAFFDFDGTLVQSEDAHRRRFAQVLGLEISPDDWFARCVGHHPPRIVRILLGDELDDAAVAARCAALEAAVPAFARWTLAGLSLAGFCLNLMWVHKIVSMAMSEKKRKWLRKDAEQ